MITKKNSGPVTNCSQLVEDPIAARNLVRVPPSGGERKWMTIDCNPSPRSGVLTKVSKMVTKMVFVFMIKMDVNKTEHIIGKP